MSDFRFTIDDFYIGNSDGKKEAAYRDDFERYFYDYDRVYERTLQKEIFLILGKKGTGKSLLGEFIHKCASKDPQWISKISSFRDFKFHELLHLKTNDISPNEYLSAWEWVLLLEIAQMLIRDESIEWCNEYRKLRDFFTLNFASLSIDAAKVVEVTRNRKAGGEFKGLACSSESGEKAEIGSYLCYLKDMKETVFMLMSKSKCKYTIIYDELDDRYRDEEEYKSCIISLIKATDSLNLEFIRKGNTAKIILLLRSDIYYKLNDPDLNKIKKDNSIDLVWGDRADINSPLFDLIISKITTSVPELYGYPKMRLFKMLFPGTVKGFFPDNFILSRTFFRPRDIITYLNLVIEAYPLSRVFEPEYLDRIERKYSEYFFQEVRNEMSGHYSDAFIDEAIQLLKKFNKIFFRYEDIHEYFEKQKSRYQFKDIDLFIKALFDFSIIGNRWEISGGKYHHNFRYRDNNATVDYDKEFLVHLGFRSEILR